jgi:sugar phosphate isomerase/epimerase
MTAGKEEARTMDLSITTDVFTDTGCPEDSLRLIAEAGFTHVHWCHQWNTDFIYEEPELRQIGAWLRGFGLHLLDLHGSNGREKCWTSPREHERAAGVLLVKNRVDMTRMLGGDAVVMHVAGKRGLAEDPGVTDRLRRSLDECLPYARDRGVRIAVENGEDNWETIRGLFGSYGPDVLGLCYDCGHGNLVRPGIQSAGSALDNLDGVKDRLLVLHLHDNDGERDQHRVPYTGTVDWPRLSRIIAESGYRKCISMESNIHQEPDKEQRGFLARAHAAGTRITEAVNTARKA